MSVVFRVPPRTVKVTAKMAAAFAEMRACHVERPFKERRVEVYRRLVAARKMRTVTWAMAYCPEADDPDKPVRVNGKHTSALYASLPADQLEGLYVTVEEYNCDTMEDVARLFGDYDSTVAAKTIGEVNVVFASTVPELAGVSKHAVNLLVGALNYNTETASGQDANDNTRKTAQDRADALFDNTEFAAWFAGNFPLNQDTKPLMRVPVVAAMHATWLKARAAALDFWTAVRDQTGEGNHLPHRKLMTFLILTRMRAADRVEHDPRARRIKYTPREFYCKSVIAWNAWRKGTTSDLRYLAAQPTPEAK